VSATLAQTGEHRAVQNPDVRLTLVGGPDGIAGDHGIEYSSVFCVGLLEILDRVGQEVSVQLPQNFGMNVPGPFHPTGVDKTKVKESICTVIGRPVGRLGCLVYVLLENIEVGFIGMGAGARDQSCFNERPLVDEPIYGR
jgi:hypothetical protein